MADRIRSLIEEGDFEEALQLIEKEIKHNGDLTIPANESRYAELVGLRVTAMTLSGKTDDVIHDVVRKVKFPNEQKYMVNDTFPISLHERNLFLCKYDAFINTIHAERLFTVSNHSATYEVVRSLGEDFIQKQLDPTRVYKKGDFILLKHGNLSCAPMSYHILCYEGANSVDLEALETGLRSVLKDAESRGLKQVGSFPLGFGYVAVTKVPARHVLARNVADKVAETVVSHLWSKQRVDPPEIHFHFVRGDTFVNYDRAFVRWTSMTKEQLTGLQNYEQRHRTLVEDCCTTDPSYIETLRKVSYSALEDTTLLMLGETGVGKSYLAGQVHKFSSRAAGPFKTVNFALIKRDQLYSQVFGWVRGSFTGSTGDGQGMIGAANKGTLFLDEVGFADLEVQRSLLTFLDEKKYNRYGDTRELTADARLIFGTNQDLQGLMREGLFDPAFYERIAGMVVTIPPLNDRKHDIKGLARKFVERLNEDRSDTVTIEAEALELLTTFRWPGNIRQLRSYVQNLYHACLRSGSEHRITRKMIEQDKPRDTAYLPDDPISALELLIRKTMIGWNDRDGRFVTDFLEPIVAKVYLDDLRLSKTDASKRIGLDGTRGKESTLEQRYLRYARLREIHER